MTYPPILVIGQAAPTATAPPTTASTAQPPAPGVFPQAPQGSGLGPGAANTIISFSLLLVLLFAAWLVIKHYKHKLTTLVLGICIGTVGATGFIGALAWALVNVFVTVLNSVGHAI